MTIGESLRYWREENSYSLKDVEVKTNINNGNLSRYERDLNYPSIEICIKLANLYHISLDDLIGRSYESEYSNQLPNTSAPVSPLSADKQTLYQERLKELRTEKNVSQKDLAKIIGTTNSSICDWERGRTQPKIAEIIKLCEFFQVSTDYLLGRTDELGDVLVSNATRLDLTDDEKDLLKLYRAMSHPQKIRLIAYGEGLVGAAPSSARN